MKLGVAGVNWFAYSAASERYLERSAHSNPQEETASQPISPPPAPLSSAGAPPARPSGKLPKGYNYDPHRHFDPTDLV